MPLMTPVAGSMTRPAGRPVAENESVSPSTSAKWPATGIETPWPSVAERSATGEVTTGASLAAVTVRMTVAVSVPPWPSETV